MNLIEYYQQRMRNPMSEELATRQNAIFMGFMNWLPNPDPILKKAGKDVMVYKDLMYDPQVGMAVEALQLSIQSLNWEIDPNGTSEAWLGQLKELIATWDIERIFNEIINARLFGYAPIEVNWETTDRKWLIKDLVGKPPDWFFYDNDNLLRFRIKTDWIRGIPVDFKSLPYKFIIARHRPTYNNPYGMATLSQCFWPVAFKKGGLRFWMQFIEKYGMPFLIGKQPRGVDKSSTDLLLENLQNMVQDAVAVIPDDSSVEIVEMGRSTQSSAQFQQMVNYHDDSIAKSIIGQTLSSSSGSDGSGSRLPTSGSTSPARSPRSTAPGPSTTMRPRSASSVASRT